MCKQQLRKEKAIKNLEYYDIAIKQRDLHGDILRTINIDGSIFLATNFAWLAITVTTTYFCQLAVYRCGCLFCLLGMLFRGKI